MARMLVCPSVYLGRDLPTAVAISARTSVCHQMPIYLMQVALPRKGDRMRTEADDEDTGHEEDADEGTDEGVL